MKTALAVVVVLMACLMVVDCIAQSTGRFQSVGGDFGRSVIGTLKASDSQSAPTGNNSLWDWGNAPKGSLIQNGKLVADPFSTWKALNYTDGWIGEVETDPYTGYSIYSYKIPNTGEIKYFYIDPYTGTPIYVEGGSSIAAPNVVGSIATANVVRSESYVLPPVFR